MTLWLGLLCISVALFFALGLFVDMLLRRMAAARRSAADSVEPRLADMASSLTPDILLLPSLVLGVGIPICIYLLSGNPVLAGASIVAIGSAPAFLLRAVVRRRHQEFEKQLPDTCQMLSSSLQAGLSLNQAIASVAREARQPTAYEFSIVDRKLRLGADFISATDSLLNRMPMESLRVAISAMRVSRRVGGNLIVLIDELADQMRTKQEMEGKINSLTAQGRIQGRVMSLLPLPLLGALYALDPESVTHMFTTPMGWATLAVIGVMLTIGYLVIQRVVRIDV